jgi:hypothetical protein
LQIPFNISVAFLLERADCSSVIHTQLQFAIIKHVIRFSYFMCEYNFFNRNCFLTAYPVIWLVVTGNGMLVRCIMGANTRRKVTLLQSQS